MLLRWYIFAAILAHAVLGTGGETCTEGFITIEPDEHKEACFFRAVKHTGCPDENDPSVYFRILQTQDSSSVTYLANGTSGGLQLDSTHCSAQFGTLLYFTSTLHSNPKTGILGQLSSSQYATTYPYILYEDHYVQGATLGLLPHGSQSSLATGLYQLTALTPIVKQGAQPHGIRKADELDHTLAYAGLGAASGLFVLLVITLVFMCTHHRGEPKDSCVRAQEMRSSGIP